MNKSLSASIKIVYVITSTDSDLILEQFWISVVSLKAHTPNALVTILTDVITRETFSSSPHRSKIASLADEIIAIDLDKSLDGKTRSRHLKTSMGNIIKGDFLFLDTDTIICEDISDLKKCDGVLSAVLNQHVLVGSSKGWDERSLLRPINKMGYHAGPNGAHFNSGVIFIHDTDSSHEFFTLWHDLWLETCKKGIVFDQISFNEANYRLKGVIKEISGVWNVQHNRNARYIAEAKILHYLTFNSTTAGKSGRDELFFQIANSGMIGKVKECDELPNDITKLLDDPKSPDAFCDAWILTNNSADYKILNGGLIKVIRKLYKGHPRLYRFLDNATNGLYEFIHTKVKKDL